MRGRRFYWAVAASTLSITGVCGAAHAADVPMVPVKAPVASAGYNWSGVYGGLHAGYGVGMKDWTNSVFDFDAKGFLGGAQIGINQQVGNWVFGIEADVSWADVKGSQTVLQGSQVFGFISSDAGTSKIDRFATVAGRIGLAQDRWLVYLKGGAVWAHENHTFNASDTIILFGGGTLTASAASAGSETRFGPIIGFGAEYAMWGNWSFKSEYNYLYVPNGVVRLAGTQNFLGAVSPFTADVRIQQAFHLVKFGVNYRFGPDAPPAIAPAPPAPGYNWTGFYVGAQAGYGFGRTVWEAFGTDGRFNADGALAGAVTGTNVQAGAFVFGVESEWMWSGFKGGARVRQDFGFGLTQVSDLASKIDWLSLSSVRAGFVAADRWLMYFKGGVALARETHGFAATQTFFLGAASDSVNASGSALHTGYLAGIGVEHAFLGSWSAKLEYNYVHFRPQSFTLTGIETLRVPPIVAVGAFASRITALEQMHLVKFGVNYHFNPLSDIVSARY